MTINYIAEAEFETGDAHLKSKELGDFVRNQGGIDLSCSYSELHGRAVHVRTCHLDGASISHEVEYGTGNIGTVSVMVASQVSIDGALGKLKDFYPHANFTESQEETRAPEE